MKDGSFQRGRGEFRESGLQSSIKILFGNHQAVVYDCPFSRFPVLSRPPLKDFKNFVEINPALKYYTNETET
jgi:hypothetical protein